MKKMKYRNRISKTIYTKLTPILKRLLKNRDALRRELAELPEGRLHIKSVGSHPACYKWIDGKEVSVSKDANETKLLARKMQALSEMKDLNICIRLFSEFLNALKKYLIKEKTLKGSISLDKLQEIFDYEVFSLNKSEKALLRRFSKTNSLYPEQLIHSTKSGIKVRSKSEKAIANALFENGIVFIYEPVLQFENFSFVPDFLILRNDGEIILWEHFGLLDNEEYKKKCELKVEQYEQNGYSRNLNLICTTEKDIHSDKILERIIRERLM